VIIANCNPSSVICADKQTKRLPSLPQRGQPLKFGKGTGPRDGSTQCPCPGGAKGNALIFRQTVPRDDVGSAASGWSKCEIVWEIHYMIIALLRQIAQS
jgi:hypothetical protein